jgi:hypothetical protein
MYVFTANPNKNHRKCSLDHDHVWSRFLKEIVLAPNCKLHEMRAKFVNNILRVVIPYDVATKTRDKPLTAKQIREIFTRHVKDLGWNELKAAFSELVILTSELTGH